MTIPNLKEIAIYHITHIDNLPGIINDNCLWSDYQRIERRLANTSIGYNHIKQRRMNHTVTVASGGTLGQYVPFNFCPRSVMLYVVNCGHDDYSGGQANIIHLVSTVQTIIDSNHSWLFTDRHADLSYALQKDNPADLNILNWAAIKASYWAEADIKELKQAEFLVHDFVPWNCILNIGVIDSEMVQKVRQMINSSEHKPSVKINQNWYY